MSDEEKKAIEYLKIEYEKLMKEDNILFPLYKSDGKRLIDIIEKQSKEIEELKIQNNKLAQCHFKYEEMIGVDLLLPDKLEYTSNDKIKAKIEELENQKRQWIEDRDNKHKDSEIIYAIEILQSLLEKRSKNNE